MIKDISVEKFFLIISLIFGFIYVFILPPFQSVDEASHFYRGYEIVNGSFSAKKVNKSVGDYLPSSLKELVSKYDILIKNVDKKIKPKYITKSAEIKLNQEKTEFINFQNTALYSPICYLTQIPGMYVGKALNSNPLIISYLGRISNLLFFTLIIYFSIKTIPFYKTTLMLIALMPMTLSLGGALTSDVMVIGFNFLWVALLLKLIFEDKKINNIQIYCLTIMALTLALLKDYFMLIPLIFLIPKTKFQNHSKYIVCMLGVLLISAVGFLFWQSIINELTFNMNSHANAFKQLHFIISHPFSYVLVLLKTFIIKTPRIIITMIGVLGWQDTHLDFLTYMLYPILIVLSIITEKKSDFNFKKWQLYLLSFDVIISICLIYTTLYLMWSEVGAPLVYGLNGKYFTPLMLPLLLLFYGKGSIKNPENIKLFIYIAVILILISSDLSLIHRFYGLTPNLHYKI